MQCGLAKASGIETPTREELARLDRKRQKRMSNQEWKSPGDEDARIGKMKDGRTHGISFLRRSAQITALSCWSRSKRMVRIPAATARLTARVVLPTPPFCAISAIVFTTAILHVCNASGLQLFNYAVMRVCTFASVMIKGKMTGRRTSRVQLFNCAPIHMCRFASVTVEGKMKGGGGVAH